MAYKVDGDHYADATAAAEADNLLGLQGGALVRFARSLLGTPAAGMLAVSTGGSDATGTRGRLDRPYLTPAAAQAAASSGDTIVVYPGTYALAAALGKAGVNWHLHAGVTLTAANSGASYVPVFADGSFSGGTTAMTFRVTGRGRLATSGTSTNVDGVPCVFVGNTASDVTIECDRITDGTTGGIGFPVWQDGGRLVVRADVIETTEGAGVYWTNGDCRILARDITATTGIAVEPAAADATKGDLYVVADRISATSPGQAAVLNASSDAGAKTWIVCPLINGGSGVPIKVSGGKLYVTGQKIVSTGGGILVSNSSAQLWLTAHKITGTSGYPIDVSAGTARVQVLQIEDLGSLTAAARCRSTGTLELTGAGAVMVAGDGFAHAGGAARLMGCRFDTTAAASKNPVTVSGTGLILDRCTLVSAGVQNSVTAASGKTITAYATKANVAKHANVTVNVDALTVDSNVV